MSAQIPSTTGIDKNIRRVLDPLKENVEQLRGRRADKIEALSTSATTAEVIAKVNEIIARLQG